MITSDSFYDILKEVIPDLPTDATKIVLTLENGKAVVVDVTREIKVGSNLIHGKREKFNLVAIK